ncbi:hypothetical protein GRI43_06035 [Altererythrobacter luteolus]|uniref:Uncharacterized protein n=1 Tax=Pontixanthobacter luteolus TaxID=295089 RepID=A0A6I4UYH5_9SPHN|nr:hypothetical protein [Pontixanthobacter luteolus]MXP46947.1 hypothetical protein [Pontixanthobacter luteolus]
MSIEFRKLRHDMRPSLMVGPPRDSAAEIRADLDYSELRRTRNSHQGLAQHQHLRELAVAGCNQAVMEEIGELTQLEKLELRWPMRGTESLEPLKNLKDLTYLKIDSPGAKVTDFTPILDLPKLEVLMITNAKHLFDIEWMKPMKNRLRILGLEGAIDTDQRIASLEPLREFAIEAFLCISMTLKSRDITPLETCPNLKFIDGAVIAPWAQYHALEQARPIIVCGWFDPKNWMPSWRGGPPKELLG